MEAHWDEMAPHYPGGDGKMNQSEPILVVMAAGMGSRYGGAKQIDRIGRAGEILTDYSLFDARARRV